MKFVCEKCQTKYSIADEKVRRKVLKIRCKNCGNVIEVREAAGVSGGAGAGGSAGEFAEPETRIEHGASAAAASSRRAPNLESGRPGARRPAGAQAEAGEWHMAIAGKEQGPFGRVELVRRLAALKPGADVHIWREDFGGWKDPSAVPEIDREVKAARSRASMPPRARGGPPPLPSVSRPPTLTLDTKPSGGLDPATPSPMSKATLMGASLAPAVAAVSRAPGAGPPAGAPRPGAKPATTGKRALPVDPMADVVTPPPAFPREAPRALSPFPIEDMTGPLGRGNGAGAFAPTVSLADVVIPSHAPGAALFAPPPSGEPPAGRPPGSQPTPPPLTGVSSVVLKRARVAGMKYAIGALAVVVVLLAILVVTLSRPSSVAGPAPAAPPPPSPAPKRVAPEELAQKIAAGEPEATAVVEGNGGTPAVPPGHTVAVVGPRESKRGAARPVHRKAGRTPVAAIKLTPAEEAAARRFADAGRARPPPGAPGRAAPVPGSDAIKTVFKNNQGAIKTCYDRALLRDRTLTRGRIDVTAIVGVSGRVKTVRVSTSSEFKVMEPCVKDAISHWAFPQSGEDYEAKFPYIFQGG